MVKVLQNYFIKISGLFIVNYSIMKLDKLQFMFHMIGDHQSKDKDFLKKD